MNNLHTEELPEQVKDILNDQKLSQNEIEEMLENHGYSCEFDLSGKINNLTNHNI
jgi:hypothetical protein